VISLDAIVAELRRRKAAAAADWSVIERVTRRGVARSGGSFRRLDDAVRIGLVVHHDVGKGRGTGELVLEGDRGDAPASIIADADARALAMIGPPWTAPAPAAPARVELVDPLLEKITDATATTALSGVPAAVDAEAIVEHVAVRLATGGSGGRNLSVAWAETRVAVRAMVEKSGRTIEIVAEARRLGDLRLGERIRRASTELDELAGAGTPEAGSYSVVLHASAHAHGGYGLWQALVAQADAALVRQGLARYRPGSEIAPRAATADDPLDVISDGTLAFGTRSAPAGDRGEPVRRFVVIERGVARGLSLDQREAALAHREPNGGIRNLVVLPGRTAADELIRVAGAAVIEVKRFAWLDLDPRTGHAVARIAAGVVHDDKGHRPIAGGTLRFDVIAALASARRSRELATEGAIHGPTALRIDGVTIT
jgi:predicted Zn-dependent protease